jgi:hypothetical protein
MEKNVIKEHITQFREGESSVGLHIAPTILFMEDPSEKFRFIDEDLSLSEEQRKVRKMGVLTSIERLSSTSGKDWARYYESIQFLKENDWYWHEQGFHSFEDYWSSKTGDSFQVWAELEAMYNFAKISCPELFTITADQAKELYLELATLRKIAPASWGGNRRKKIHATEQEAILRVKEASLTPVKLSSQSLEKRFARIRRDNPEVAAKILQGHFIRKTTANHFYIDMPSAEREAYGEEKMSVKKAKDRTKHILNIIKSISENDNVELIIEAMKNNPIFSPYIKQRLSHAKTSAHE